MRLAERIARIFQQYGACLHDQQSKTINVTSKDIAALEKVEVIESELDRDKS